MLNSPNDHNAEVVLQVKNEQSAGYDIIELETHTQNPVFNLIHTSIDCKEVLNIPHNYYVELKLRSSAGQLGLVLTAGIIDNYYNGCLATKSSILPMCLMCLKKGIHIFKQFIKNILSSHC